MRTYNRPLITPLLLLSLGLGLGLTRAGRAEPPPPSHTKPCPVVHCTPRGDTSARPPPRPSATPPSNTAASASYNDLLEQADVAVDQGRLAESRAALLAAWHIWPSRVTACNIGRLAYRLGDIPQAAEFLQRCTRSASVPTSETQRKRRAGELAEFADARSQIAVLQVSTNLPGAEIFVDGRPMGRAPFLEEAFVLPGEHRVTAQLDGFVATEQIIRVDKGASLPVTVTLTPTSPPAPGRALTPTKR